MEQHQNTANLAFQSFLAQDYKACMEALNELKTANLQSEKDVNHIKQNSLLAEFAGGKIANVNHFLAKLEELFSEAKSQNVSMSKSDSTKVSGDSDDDLSTTASQEIDDSGILKYNYAVALQLAGKKYQSVPLLDDLFKNKESVDEFILLKASFTYLDIAITQKDFALIKMIMEFLETIKKYVGIARATPLISANLEDDKETAQAEPAAESSNQPPKEIQNYNSLIFDSEIYRHGSSSAHVCRLEFNFLLNIYQIYLLISLKETEMARKKLNSCRNLFNHFTKVIKDGKDEKGNINGRYVQAISPYVDRHANILYSFAKAYFAYHTQAYGDCMKLLNTIEALTFFGEEIPSYTAFQLNNIACCHLRMKKFNLAAYYLSKALGIVQKLSRESSSDTKKYERVLNLNAVQHYPVLLHNYALAVLQMGKYDEAAEAYSSLAEFWPDNAKVWYRTALCHLNKYQEILADNQNQRKNGIYQSLLDVPNYAALVDEEKFDQSKSKKTEDIEHKESPYYTRYVLNVRDNTVQKTEEESSGAPGPKFVSQNPELNKGNEGTPSNLTDKQLRMHLEKAAKCFRNTVLIIKKKKSRFQKEQPVHVSFSYQDQAEGDEANEGEGGEGEDDKEKSFALKTTRNPKDYQDILQSSLAYLAYSSLSLGEINNTINYAKECLDLPFITDETKYICLMYLVEAYCYLGNQKEALNQMNSANVTQTILTVARNALGINQAYFTKGLSSKVVIYTNLATAHILNNNLTGAQNAINIALSNIDQALLQVPMSLLNLMIYLNLKLDKPETALQILKRRRILNSGNNKLLLRIVKWMN